MKRMLIAIAVLATTVMPAIADDLRTPDMQGQAMSPHHGMMMEKMPQHPLIMAYHKNLIAFGHALDRLAHQGETVPVEYARTAISEMKRSVDQLEKYRAETLHNMPADMKGHADMQKKMDEYLVNVKMHLRELETLAKSDRIPSPEVIKQLAFIFEACEGMDCEMGHGKGMHCRGMHGKGMHDCRCQGMMPERAKMMREMMQQMKTQDAEMAKQIAEMNVAPKDRKLDLLADIVTRMVKQHTAMTNHMEKMMQKHMQQGTSVPPAPAMKGEAGGGYLNEDEEVDMDTPDEDMNE